MKSRLSKTQGITILEVLLVLVIAASVIGVGIQQYLAFKTNSEVNTVKNNVDLLFEVALRYLKVNCTANGNLDPQNYSDDIIGIKISTLRTSGFLEPGLPFKSTLIDSSNEDKSYVIQFNRVDQDVNVCMDETDSDCTTNKKIGVATFWKIQISPKFYHQETADRFKLLMNADCTSDLSATVVNPRAVEPCAGNTPGKYVVFERLPSTAATGIESRSSLQPSLPQLDQIKSQTESGPMSYLLNKSHDTEYQYFRCGG